MSIIPTELILPPRTITRSGAATDLLAECAAFGERGMLVHGKSLAASGVLDRILNARPAGLTVRTWQHAGGEPTLSQVEELLGAARTHQADWIAGVGGGSVLDLAKACAGLFRAPLPPVAYHDGERIVASYAIPFLAVPTTAGTGSEATVVTVLTNTETGVKKSFRHRSHMARVVILDPDLVAACPPGVIAHSGMDALTQAIESYVSLGASWLTDELCLKAISLIAPNLEDVFSGEDRSQAEDLLVGSYLAGVALTNAKLGLVHGLAHPLGARYRVTHGLACAVCVPFVLEFNRLAIEEKYDRMSQAAGNDLLTVVRELEDILRIRSPFAGMPVEDKSRIVEETLASGSTAANPRKVTAQDVEYLLGRIFRAV